MNNMFYHFHRVFRLCLSLALAAVMTTLTWATLAHAQHPGDLDPTFNGTGIVTTTITGYDYGTSVAVQPDGKIVVGFFSNHGPDSAFGVARYTITGTLDTTFNQTGVVTTPAVFSVLDSIAIQADGKIVVAGLQRNVDSSIVVMRYTITGSLDTTFNNTGVVTTGPGQVGYAMVVQPDGKIIVAGASESYYSSSHIIVARYTITGSLDSEFNQTGIVTTPIGNLSLAAAVALQPDGKIIVAGLSVPGGIDQNTVVVRYTITGSLDTNFNSTGFATQTVGSDSYINSVALQPDGKIVMVGEIIPVTSYSDFMIMRYNNNGSPDTTFNHTGVVTTSITPYSDNGHSVIIQSDGKIVVAGASNILNNKGSNFAVARYNHDGSLDTTFNHTGIVTTSISNDDDGWSAALQPADGKIVVAGYSCVTQCAFAVVRYIGQYDHSAYLPVILKD